MLILDTDLVSLVQRGQGEAYQILLNRLEGIPEHETVYVTIVSFEEQTRGWLAQIAKARTKDLKLKAYRRLHVLLRDYCDRSILDMDERSLTKFEALQKQRIRIGTMDLKIGSIALSNGATLLSRNLDDFQKVPDLDVADWTKPL
jgi:tRNA(fMet)-specific endonuclease VapC